MKLADSLKIQSGARALVTIIVACGLAACSAVPSANVTVADGMPPNGPQADYPILLGEPYEIAGTGYTPADVLNYDEVGYLTLDPGFRGYSGSHHTLPVPSYVEVTSLESGRTVLVRLERRGPMKTNHLVALSPAAMAQLGANEETPVRVRRVNPPEMQRAMLRAGEAAPVRMDTPSSLLTVLQRRLPANGSASLASSAEPPRKIEAVPLDASSAASSEALPPAIESAPALAQAQVASPESAVAEPAAQDAPVSAKEGGLVVQAAAFASQDNARRAANALGGTISRSGRYYRVQTGPFATRGEAEASLANVRRAGYS
ncbi:MAG: SPOR domain-containing protein, partial [Alteraurantiacibacter sp.]